MSNKKKFDVASKKINFGPDAMGRLSHYHAEESKIDVMKAMFGDNVPTL